jgi:hypothetical protein
MSGSARDIDFGTKGMLGDTGYYRFSLSMGPSNRLPTNGDIGRFYDTSRVETLHVQKTP